MAHAWAFDVCRCAPLVTTHVILVIAVTALLIAALIWIESMRRHTSATKAAERKRRRANDRRQRQDARESEEHPPHPGRKHRR